MTLALKFNKNLELTHNATHSVRYISAVNKHATGLSFSFDKKNESVSYILGEVFEINDNFLTR